MTGDQWFSLWLAIGQTLIGGAVAVGAVFLGATAALRQQAKTSVTDRSRRAAEEVLGVIDRGWREMHGFYGTVNFVIQPTPGRVDDDAMKVVDVIAVTERVGAEFSRLGTEVRLLEPRLLRDQLDWAVKCSIDFSLRAHAAVINPDRFSPSDLAATASQAADFYGHMITSVESYLRTGKAAIVDKPMYWTTPVDDNPEPAHSTASI